MVRPLIVLVSFAAAVGGCRGQSGPAADPAPNEPGPTPAVADGTGAEAPAMDAMATEVRRIVKAHGKRQQCNDLNGCPMVSTLTLLGAKASGAIRDLYAQTRSDAFWRRKLLEVLGRTGDRSNGAFLVNVLRTDDPYAREEAALALGRLGDPARRDDLKRALEGLDPDEYRGVYLAVGYALAKLGDPDGRRLIRQHLVIPFQPTRRWDKVRPGIYAAGQLRMTDLRSLVEDASRRGDPFVRREAAMALGMMRDRAGVGALIERLDDPIPGVRQAAQQSLESLTGFRHKTTRSEWERWWAGEKDSGRPAAP